MTIRILAFSGSARTHSFNQKLLEATAQGAIESAAEVTHISLRDYPLPLYDGDVERELGLPDQAAALQELLKQCDALMLASPEYNGGYSALLKNAIDWMSRPNPQGGSGLAHFANKPVAVVSASPGLMGGTRGLVSIRAVLDKLGMIVIPQSFALGLAHESFDAMGRLKDPKADAGVRAVGAALAETARKLAR